MCPKYYQLWKPHACISSTSPPVCCVTVVGVQHSLRSYSPSSWSYSAGGQPMISLVETQISGVSYRGFTGVRPYHPTDILFIATYVLTSHVSILLPRNYFLIPTIFLRNSFSFLLPPIPGLFSYSSAGLWLKSFKHVRIDLPPAQLPAHTATGRTATEIAALCGRFENFVI